MQRMKRALALALGMAVLVPAGPVSGQAAPAPAAGPPKPAVLGQGPWDIDSEMARLHVDPLARGLDHPWSLAILLDGSMLITERPGRLRLYRDGTLVPKPISGLPAIYSAGLAGLMDIALHPDFANNHLIYLSYSKPDPESPQNATLAVLRARWDGGTALSDVEDIFVADAWYGKPPLPQRCCGQGPSFGSFGGRIAFGPDGYLYVTSGDRNYGEKVHEPGNHFGKILRLTDAGKPAPGNPFAGKAGWKPEIWSTGHRNPLGLSFDPATGRLWETEFGPRGGDELNLIEKGADYGWIEVTQGHHYNGEPAEHIRGVNGKTDPIFSFGPPSINPGNIIVYHGAAFPGWEGDLLMPTMSKVLVRIETGKSGAVTAMETMLGELNQRLRDVKIGPDGAVFLLTDEKDGALLKITPALPSAEG